MKSLRMATFNGRPWRAERAANGLSLSCFATSSRPENADLGVRIAETATFSGCVVSFAGSFETTELVP